MEKFYHIPIAFLLVGLCVTLVWLWAVGTANNYGYDESLINEGPSNYTKLEESINNANEDALVWQEKFRSDSIIEKASAIILFSVFGVINLIWSSIIDLWNILTEIVFTTFGIPAIVFGTLTAILIIVLIFLAWESLKT